MCQTKTRELTKCVQKNRQLSPTEKIKQTSSFESDLELRFHQTSSIPFVHKRQNKIVGIITHIFLMVLSALVGFLFMTSLTLKLLICVNILVYALIR